MSKISDAGLMGRKEAKPGPGASLGLVTKMPDMSYS